MDWIPDEQPRAKGTKRSSGITFPEKPRVMQLVVSRACRHVGRRRKPLLASGCWLCVDPVRRYRQGLWLR